MLIGQFRSMFGMLKYEDRISIVVTNFLELIKQYIRLIDARWVQYRFLDIKCKRKLELRNVMDAILEMLRAGFQWRNLPDCYLHCQAVFGISLSGMRQNVFEDINIVLNNLTGNAAPGMQIL
jgi:hypothetical protein